MQGYEIQYPGVALLMEGVDRNTMDDNLSLSEDVALLMEGVDRNKLGKNLYTDLKKSPSSWRAWIEIMPL